MVLNLMQLAILAVLFSPEDPKAWSRRLEADRTIRFRRKTRARYNARQAEWRKKNPPTEEDQVKRRAYIRRRKAADPSFLLLERIRGRVLAALKNEYKASSTQELLGCTVPELKAHLEKQFKPGMSWTNKHLWHIDHKKPCAAFDLSDPAQQRECFHFSNLQPLWALENIRKGTKYVAAV